MNQMESAQISVDRCQDVTDNGGLMGKYLTRFISNLDDTFNAKTSMGKHTRRNCEKQALEMYNSLTKNLVNGSGSRYVNQIKRLCSIGGFQPNDIGIDINELEKYSGGPDLETLFKQNRKTN